MLIVYLGKDDDACASRAAAGRGRLEVGIVD